MRKSSKTIIATWFHADESDSAGSYSQTLGVSYSQKHYQLYLQCIYVFFQFLEIHMRKEDRYFFVNPHGYSQLDETLLTFLSKSKVKIVILQNTHIPPAVSGKKWRNQFFILDILEYLAKLEKNIIILDSDVITKSDKEIRFTEDREVLAYILSDDQDEIINGIKVSELSKLYEKLSGEKSSREIGYLGGEFLVISGNSLKKFHQLSESYYSKNWEFAVKGETFFREEAHLFSIVSAHFKLDVGGDQVISRIWTQPWTFRSIPDNLEELIFWHLPAEKKTGFRRIYRTLRVGQYRNFRQDEFFEKYVRELVGVPRYSLSKLLRDMIDLRSGLFRHLSFRLRNYFGKIFL
jgi:hypothetical protein